MVSINKPIVGANVVLHNIKTDYIEAYTVSDNNGIFSLKYLNEDSLNLEVTCLGYEKLEIKITGRLDRFLTLELKAIELQLQDVNIQKIRPITLKNDTIVYNTKMFSDKSDRVIIDIIKKIPGIKVTETGQILFNNKAINKLYIDGKDLLEDRYNIASNNLPVDAVDQIQVLQNHQPITLLRNGVEQSYRAAINIKLKENDKFRLLGNCELGLGIKPFLRDNNLTFLKFSHNLQFINSLKNNNVGINLDKELTDQNFSNNLYESGSIKQDLLSLVKASIPPFSQVRYLFNNNTIANSNYLIGVNKRLDLKVNVAYECDQLADTASSVTKIYLPDNTITINENHIGLNSNSKLLSGVILQRNEENIFFKNALKFQRMWSIAKDCLVVDNINQKLKNPFINLINDLESIINFNNNLIGIKSFTSYTNLPQKLCISPGQYSEFLNNSQYYDNTLQNVQLRGVFTDNSMSFVKKMNRFCYKSKIGILIQSQILHNNLSVVQNSLIKMLNGDFENIIYKNKLRLYNESNLNLNVKEFSLTIGLTTNISKLNIKSLELKENENKTFINPNFSAFYKINSFWENSLSLSLYNQVNYDSNRSYILQDYRSLVNYSIPLKESKSKNISYHVGYKNVVSGVYSNLNLSYSKSSSNILTSTEFNGILATRIGLIRNNPYSDLNLNFNISKYFTSLETIIDLSLSYDRAMLQQLQQEALLDFTNNIYALATRINSNLCENIVVTHSINLNVTKNSSKLLLSKIDYPSIYFLKQNLTLKYFLRNLQANINLEHYYNKANNSCGLRYCFADLAIQKTLLKSKLDFSITLANIFNTKVYNSYSYDSNIFINSRYTIRDRMLMFKTKFQF